MAARETRLLLLGAVKLFGPVNGYQIRRELLTWGVQNWAYVNPGSIYSGLTTLTSQGLLVRHDLPDGQRTVAVYELTDDGLAEFHRLFEVALTEVSPNRSVAFSVAFAQLPQVPRETALRLLRIRIDNLRADREGTRAKLAQTEQLPPHVLAMLSYGERAAGTELDWLTSLVGDIDAGALEFEGEDRWVPPADDPGHVMTADRERYRQLLGH